MFLRNHAGKLEDDGNQPASASENQPALNNLPADGAEWIDFFVREMMVATSVDDARARAARILEVLEKSISARARAEVTDALQKVFMLESFKIHGVSQTLSCRSQVNALCEEQHTRILLGIIALSFRQYCVF